MYRDSVSTCFSPPPLPLSSTPSFALIMVLEKPFHAWCSFHEDCIVRVSMFTGCGGVSQAGVAAVRRTLQLYKSLMRPSSLKAALLEQHKYSTPPSRPIVQPSPCVIPPPGAQV
jgi:hypothetical protein